jgi:hypothetical protein
MNGGFLFFFFLFLFFLKKKKIKGGKEKYASKRERGGRFFKVFFIHFFLIYIYIYIYIKNMRNAIHTSKYAFFEVILKIAVRIQKFEINTNH